MSTTGDSTTTRPPTAASSYEDGGGGAGGKFRKKPFRRHQSTPYDRPPTSIPRAQQRNGWLTRIVDPASKLLTAGAHRLFASVFRKRLLPPPPQQPQQQQNDLLDRNEDRRDNQQEAATMENLRQAEETIAHKQESVEGLKDNVIATVEQILREKNITRDEFDHLTQLMRSRTIDPANGDVKETLDKTLEENHARHSRDRTAFDGPLLENQLKFNELNVAGSTPALGNVLEEDMASPVHVAKAYMASKSAKVSPSMRGLRNQVQKEQMPFTGSPFHLRSPSISVPSKHLCPAGGHENSFLMSRSRGKSAIYSMPRTPYSRVHTSLLHKGSETTFDAGPSTMSQNALAVSLLNEPKNSALKRRISVLDNDIGSVGPIRRIRQKPNLLSSRSRTSRIAWDTEQAAVGISPTVQPAEDHFPLNAVAEKKDVKLGFMHNPSKSVEMGQRILQQLDRISPKEKPKDKNFNVAGKSAVELIPTMSQGHALRRLETADTSKFQHSFQLNNQNRASHVVQDLPNSTYKNEDKGSDDYVLKGPRFHSGEVAPDFTVGAGLSIKASQDTSSPTNADRKLDNPPKKKRTFQISAFEDYVEVDDDMHANGDNSTSLNGQKKGGSNVDSEVPTKHKKVLDVPNPPGVDEVVSVQKNLVFGEQKSSPISLSYKHKDPEHPAHNAPMVDHYVDFTFPSVPAASAAFPIIGKAVVVSQASKSSKKDASPQLDAPSPVFVLPPTFPTESSSLKGIKPEISNSAVASTPLATSMVHISDKIDDISRGDAEKISREGGPHGFSSAAELSSSTFSFEVHDSDPNMGRETTGTSSVTAPASSPVLFSNSSTNQSFSNGFVLSSSSTAASAVATVAAKGTGSEASPIFFSGSGFSATFTATPSLVPPIFKFGNAQQPDASASQTSASFVSETTESVLKKNGIQFGIADQPAASTSQTSSSFVAETTEPEPKRKGTAHDSQRSPSISAPSSTTAGTGFFGFKAPASENGGSLFSSSIPTFNPFSSGSDFGSNPVGSSSMTFSLGTTTSMSSGSGTSGTLGSSWQSSNPPLFNSTFNSSSWPFTFEASSSTAVAAASSSAPMVFGASGASSSPVFSFANTIACNPMTPSSSLLGNTNSMFTFGLIPPNNGNDQMNMEDSMAEDSIQVAAPSVPAFGQSPMATPPSSGFVFGATPSPVTNPFQFGGQPNVQVPTPGISPFQPSGSLESNPGSFSLGTGGNDKSNRRYVKVKKTARKR